MFEFGRASVSQLTLTVEDAGGNGVAGCPRVAADSGTVERFRRRRRLYRSFTAPKGMAGKTVSLQAGIGAISAQAAIRCRGTSRHREVSAGLQREWLFGRSGVAI